MTGSRTATIGGSPPIPPPGWARLTDRIIARLRARAIDDKLEQSVESAVKHARAALHLG
ncbi:MAG TPA: hypothetical protein VHR37_07585 [Solirubrobacterales bacterium]|jgi:hypothetical protein|nr:hypothetical protein [Solirubrobacterales bacterium]